MKYLGVDYGAKRIGIAVSDDQGTIAFPLEIISNNKDCYKKIISIIMDRAIEAVVVGESVHIDGTANELQKHITIFKENLYNYTQLPIFYEKEWMSSIAAESHLYGKSNIANEKWSGSLNMKRRAFSDDKAAAVILQRFLDRKSR